MSVTDIPATYQYAWSGRTVTVGVLDDIAVEAFTDGDCHVFATALARITGGDVYAISTVVDGEPNYVCHYVVKLPDGRYADVEGPADEQMLLDRWAARNNLFTDTDPAMVFLAQTAPQLVELVRAREAKDEGMMLHPATPLQLQDPDDVADVEVAVTIAKVAVDRYQLHS